MNELQYVTISSKILFQVCSPDLLKKIHGVYILIFFTFKIIKELNMYNNNYTKNTFCTLVLKE